MAEEGAPADPMSRALRDAAILESLATGAGCPGEGAPQ